MKKFAGLLLVGYVLCNSFSAIAQTYVESALIFSRIKPGGSARIQALGGAQVSLGGDYSSTYANPAGLGMYNRSEFAFSPGFNSAGTTSDYLGTSTPATQSKVIIPGLSLVLHSSKSNGKLISGSFGFSYNRTNDFNRTFEYSGTNNASSIIDYFAGDATSQNKTPDVLFDQNGTLYNDPTGLAWDNFLINTVSPTDQTHYVTDVSGIPFQHERVQTTGAQSQWTFSYGINLADKFFIGAGLGFTSINYSSTKQYDETFAQDTLLNSLSLVENLRTRGTGINLTLGAIARPIDILQIGVSVATPTAYVMSDTYNANLGTVWRNFPYGAANLPPNPVYTDDVYTDYSYRTPWRLSGGATVFIEKHGFVTADVEYVNYAGSHYSSSTDAAAFDQDNHDINDLYHSVFNLRLGAEYRIKSYRVRGGYSYMPDPYRAIQNDVDNSIQSITGGVGYRATKFFIDLTAVLTQGKTSYFPYTGAPQVSNQNGNTLIMATIGFPF